MSVTASQRPCVFLDRDGVLVEERGLPFGDVALRLVPGAADALVRLAAAGYALAVATNQTAIARGLTTEAEVAELHRRLAARLTAEGAPAPVFFVCPHHPNADVKRYRIECHCRKPRPGLLLRAAAELGIDLTRSVMVGDRISDVAAGVRAGCRAVLVRSGAHLEPPIETPDPPEPGLRADAECGDLDAAVDWILAEMA